MNTARKFNKIRSLERRIDASTKLGARLSFQKFKPLSQNAYNRILRDIDLLKRSLGKYVYYQDYRKGSSPAIVEYQNGQKVYRPKYNFT